MKEKDESKPAKERVPLLDRLVWVCVVVAVVGLLGYVLIHGTLRNGWQGTVRGHDGTQAIISIDRDTTSGICPGFFVVRGEKAAALRPGDRVSVVIGLGGSRHITRLEQ